MTTTKTKGENKRPTKEVKKTWTLDEIRSECRFFGYRGFDLLTSAAFSALRRNDESRTGIRSQTRLTAEDVAETIKELREGLEREEKAMENFLEGGREALDTMMKMIS